MAISKIPSAGFQDNVKFRNIIINGDMSIAQRGTSATGITNGTTYDTVDRWQTIEAGASATYTMAQTALTSSDTPFANGFPFSIKYDCTVAGTSANGLAIFRQRIEGQLLQYLGYGTSNAKSLTLSFWVKSNVTGTAVASLFDNDNSKHQAYTYTINSANTWEKKTMTFSGNTSNTFDNDNNPSLYLSLIMSAGTNYQGGTLPSTWTAYSSSDFAEGQTIDISANTANEISFTGVQLEAASAPSDFEFLPYDVNLRRCMRYYWVLAKGIKHIGTMIQYSTADARVTGHYIVPMRTKPSLDQVSGTDYYRFYRNASNDRLDDFIFNTNYTNEYVYQIYNATDISGTGGQAGWVQGFNGSVYIAFDAEL